jgi:N-acetylmuramoyl-L-alanine amidase
MKDSSDVFGKLGKSCIFLISLALILVGGGCIYEEVPAPVITGEYRSPVRPVLVSPAPAVVSGPDVPAEWIPTGVAERKWTAVIIHHSATAKGNMAVFDKEHREERHWEGIGYDFVIGNGTGSGDGQVEVTFRWTQQKAGAHVGGTPANWANEQGIGICLVGDFNRTSPSWRQMQSLTKLVSYLQKRYGISSSRVYGHGTTPGAKVTDCPGRNFPMTRFKANLP